jgi:hypothetical protein
MAFGDKFPGWDQKNAYVLRHVDEYAERYDQAAQEQIRNYFYPVPPGNYSSGLYAFHNSYRKALKSSPQEDSSINWVVEKVVWHRVGMPSDSKDTPATSR